MPINKIISGEIPLYVSSLTDELPLEFYLTGNDYEDLIAQEENITNLIQKNVKYVLRVDLTISTTKDLKVKRLIPIRFPITNDKSKVIRSQRGFITLLVLGLKSHFE